MPARNFGDLWGSRGVFGSNNPFTEVQRDLNRLFGDTFRRGTLRVDVRENDFEVCVVADVPGVTPADLDLRVDGATLTLTAERQGESERQEANYHVMERSRGVMRRTVQLPFAPDPELVDARYENGVLTVHLPKAAATRQGKRIDVRGGASASGQASNATNSGSMGSPGGAADTGTTSRAGSVGSPGEVAGGTRSGMDDSPGGGPREGVA